ncbi:hypothetical protein [Pseudodesulfovibrio karagichevae]|uniref:SprA-related family protein n=1 Tax=Pseudodesulfovibrio karagichevae TaxID=3239305 RepID=A0ABV4K630_9BACT
MINPIAQGYGVQSVGTPSFTPRTASPGSGTGGTGDTVTISEEARAMSAAAAAKAKKDSEAPSLGLLSAELPLLTPEELAQKAENVQSRITALFMEQGIPTDPPAELYTDEAGAIRVKGDHPHKDEIEAALAGDEALSNDFRMVSAQAEIQKAAERHTAFAAAYAKDPDAAVARFAYLFDDIPDDPFTMTIGGSEEA